MRRPTSGISIAAIEANENFLVDTAQLNFNSSPETKMVRPVAPLLASSKLRSFHQEGKRKRAQDSPNSVAAQTSRGW
jgi:hypothetical protein